MSAENVAIVKSSWAGWRQGLRAQMVRDFGDGVAERVDEWAEAAGRPGLQPEEFVDGGDVVLVSASADEDGRRFWFNYTMDGRLIAGWDAYEDEAQAREAAGLPT
jgi:hypothetical protein